MSELEDMLIGLSQRQNSAVMGAVGAIQESPDEAVRAIELSRSTGVPAPVIAGDLENFEQQHKSSLASSIVRGNPLIAEYINSHPLASRVSNDDWGNLDQVSQSAGALARSAGRSAAPAIGSLPAMGAGAGLGGAAGTAVFPGIGTAIGAIAGAIAGGIGGAYGVSLLQDWIVSKMPESMIKGSIFDPEIIRQDLTLHPTASFIGSQVPFALTMKPNAASIGTRAISAGGNVGLEAGQELWQEGTVDPIKLGIAATVGATFANPNVVGSKLIGTGDKLAAMAVKARPWLEAGKEPPRGIDPDIDALKAQRNDVQLEELNQVLSDSMKSLTRERSPEMFADFMRQHMQDSKIGIGPDAILALYGDKPPMPDDGLLGWVPGIKEQIEAARATGVDVQVPLADWIAKVEPDVAKALQDDIRVSPGNITKREAQIEAELKAAAPEADTTPIDSPLAQTRGATALEPMFSIGDRKLKLERLKGAEGSKFGPEQGFHDFTIQDQNGIDVGTINLSLQKGGKEVYIDMINGINGLGPRDFGPSLIRDIFRQIRAEFPEATTIVGHRVTGARDKFETYDQPSAMVRLDMSKLDVPEGWRTAETTNEFMTLLRGGEWQPISPSVDAYYKPKHLQPADRVQIANEVLDIINRIAPKARGEVVERLRARAGTAGGPAREFSPAGVMTQYRDMQPLIAVALDGVNPRGTAFHETIHYLRREGFLSEAEWNTLQKAVADEGWIDRYGLRDRYPNADAALLNEEAIAEGFRNYMARKESQGRIGGFIDQFRASPVDAVFQKLKDLFESVKAKLREIIGREPTMEDLFEKINIGEIGRREGAEPLDPRAYREAASIDEVNDVLRANATGLDLQSFKRLQKLIEARHAEDVAAATKRAEREQRKIQSKEWKDRERELRPQVVEDIKSRPSVAADLFLNSGELFGQKFDHHRLHRDSLTEAQIALLPDHYLTTNKLSPTAQDVASATGFRSVDEMIAALNGMREIRGKQTGEAFRRGLIDAELQKRMESEFGLLEKNIMEEAKDQALSETQLNLLAEEAHGAAMMAGQAPFDADAARVWVWDNFQKLKVGDISSDRFLDTVGKLGRNAERALIAGKPVEAVQFMQQKFMAGLYAKHARDLENAMEALDKTAKRFSRAEVKGIEPEFTDHIHSLLLQAGYKVRRSPEDIARGFDFHGQGDLPTFVARTSDSGWDPVVADWLQQTGAKKLEEMTASEFDDFKNAIDSLNHIGREINKIEVAGAKQEFAEFRTRVIENIQQLPARKRESQGRWLYNIDASLTRMEEIAKDLDLRQELGPMWDAVIRPMVLSKTKEYDLMTELANHFRETKGAFGKDWRKSLGDSIQQDLIYDPYTQAPYDMTRENLINIMLNWGNRSNIEKYVNGAGFARFGRRLTKEEAGQFEQAIKVMIDTHARPEDWQFVQRMWEPFKKWQPMMDTVARNTSGVAPKWIEVGQVETPHGSFEGGYWPVKYDRLGSNISLIEDRAGADPRGVFDRQYFRAATSKGYLKERTGYVDFVDISTSIEQAAGTMQQTIHDIAFRDALIQASKVFYDPQIRAAIRKHYGAEYEAQLVPWLKRISYQWVADDSAMKGFNDFLRRTRMNLVGHALPLNLKVILSPDVGVPNPIAWTKFLANRKENMAFALEKSQELRHLVYNLDRDYTEALNRITSDPTASELRKKAVDFGYKPVAAVSQEFRAATFIDEYNKARGRGKTDTEATLIADSAIRERHGAASIVDLPAALQSNEGMKMLTVFQGYFNTMYNWQRQLPGQARRGEVKNFIQTAAGTIGVGAAFGALLFNQQKQDDSWFKTIAKALVIQPLSTIPVLNSATSYAFEGFSPRMPFASVLTAAGAVLSDAKKVANRQRPEKPITHAANVVGLSTGLPLAQVGRTTQFGYDVAKGYQKPRNISEYARGIISGEARLK